MTETKTAPAAGLFGMAKQKPAPSKSAKEKEAVKIGSYSAELTRFSELKELIESHSAELKMLEGVIKTRAADVYIKKYIAEKKRPDSFKLVSDEGAGQLLLIVMDKYLKVDESKKAALAGYADVIETNTVYSFNPEVLERCGEAVSNAIMNSEDISEADKAALLIAAETSTVKKGMLDRLMQYGNNAEKLFSLIEPIIQLKNSR